VRYHGIFANRSRMRRHLPPPPPRQDDPEPEVTVPLAPPTSDASATVPVPPPAARRRLPWAQLLLHPKSARAHGRPRLPHRSRRRRQDPSPLGTPHLPAPLGPAALLGGPTAPRGAASSVFEPPSGRPPASNRWGRLR
jgi:hypothetical protein